MASFDVEFDITVLKPYNNRALHVPEQTHRIKAQFSEGSGVFTSEPFEVGILHSFEQRPIIGKLSLKYSYDPTSKLISVCDTDYPSADGMTLITRPKDTEQYCFEHAAECGFAADELHRNRYWNYHSQLMPGAPETFKSIVRSANDALIKALKEKSSVSVHVRKLLPKLDQDVYEKLCSVYEDEKLLGSYHDVLSLGPHFRVTGFDSEADGEVTFGKEQDYANVIGSTGDPFPTGYGSFLAAWEGICNNKAEAQKCASYDWAKLTDNNKTPPDYDGCNTDHADFVGGHIITGTKARELDKAKPGDYFILPICKTHNSNNSWYMNPVVYRTALKLKDYAPTVEIIF